ncbi:MAG: 3D domain-containing protein [Bacilli bacterium]|nr:3D domain-containing protein [Bacilli bacterium]
MKLHLSARVKKRLKMTIIILLLFMINATTQINKITVADLNKNRSKEIDYQTLTEIKRRIPEVFVGNMTAYSPYCIGCSGKVGCYPYQDVRNDNIYFNDDEFGKVRIVAADGSIPCGSIIEISNFKQSEVLPTDTPIKAIVLDRGGAVKGKTIDLLFNTHEETEIVGRQRDVVIKILRRDR